MKKLFTIAGIAALAACSPAETEAPAPDAMAENTTAAEPWTGFEPRPVKVTNAEGETVDYMLNEDGTFVMTTADGQAMNGTMTMDGAKGCFKFEGDEEDVMCWTNAQPGPDGSWQATSDAGETVTVTPTDG